MAPKNRPQVIAIEEHYLDPEVLEKTGGRAGGTPRSREKLADLGEVRLNEMDEAGVDIQVLSHCPPGAQAFDAETAAAQARAVNDRLHQTVTARPDRFAAFATLPLKDPSGSAAELERCVDKLGFKGAMVHGLSQGRFLDEKDYWPIYERELPVRLWIRDGPGALSRKVTV